jgi:hypothetical protein
MWAFMQVIIDLFMHQEGAREYVLTHFQIDTSKPDMPVQGRIYGK